MPVKVPYLGWVSFYRIGTRQLRLRGWRKRNKPLFVLKTKSVPSATPYILRVWLNFAEAAKAARGKTMEEVVYSVIQHCSGKRYKPESVIEAERRAKFARTDAHIALMRELIAQYGKRGVYKGLPPAPETLAAEMIERYE